MNLGVVEGFIVDWFIYKEAEEGIGQARKVPCY